MKILGAAEKLGVDVARLLARTNAPFTFGQLRSGEFQTIPRMLYVDIYREAMLTLEAIATRNSGRTPVTPEEYGLMWQSAITCRTLGAVIERVAVFSQMLEGRMGAVALRGCGNDVAFVLDPMRPEQNAITFVTELIGMLMFDQMFSWLIGERLPVDSIDFSYPQPFAVYVAHGLTERRLRFGQPEITFRFPAILLDRPVVRSAEELDALLPLTVLSVTPQAGAGPVSRRILHLFDEAIVRRAAIPRIEELATALRCSPATLRRRLAAEGVSLRQLKEQRRLGWAIEMLRQSDLPVAEIAVRTGFSDETAFRRAFKQWSGEPPSAFRRP